MPGLSKVQSPTHVKASNTRNSVPCTGININIVVPLPLLKAIDTP